MDRDAGGLVRIRASWDIAKFRRKSTRLQPWGYKAEFGKAFESLCDSMLPSHPPLGLDFGTFGFQSKQSPDQNVTSLARTQQQAVTCRL